MIIAAIGQDGIGDHLTNTTELDSHANMIVLGGFVTIIQPTGQFADVNAFTSDVNSLSRVPIVDAVFAYDCPYTSNTYLIVARNALYVPSMTHNLVPPFIMREAGLQVDERARIHTDDVTKDSHAIFDPDANVHIPLQLNGTFSYFPSRGLTNDEIDDCESMTRIFVSPDCPTWNPYNPVWAEQEASYLDKDGDVILRDPPKKSTLFTENDAYISAMEIDPVSEDTFEAAVDATISSAYSANPQEEGDFEHVKLAEDAIRACLASADATADPDLMEATISDRLIFSKFATAMGSTTINDDGCELFEAMSDAAIGSTTVGKRKGVTAEHLSKIWRIDHKMAERTLDQTTQLNRRGSDSTLARHFGTNDRFLRYKRIASWFYTDTLFVTESAKSTRGYICMQIFVSDKGFVKVYPMLSPREFPSALRMFAKDVGCPEVLVADPHPSQKSKEVKDFCNKIGTTLRILEQSTQFANRAELYIGLLKEAVRKDMRDSHSPLVLWDYCAERRAAIFSLTSRDLFQLQGSNPYTATFGEQGDISNLCQFAWYDWAYYYDESSVSKFPFPKAALCRVLGPAKNEGNEMAQWILKQNGKVVPRRTVVPLTPAQLAPSNEVEARKRADYDNAIRSKLGDSFTLPPAELTTAPDNDFFDDFEPYFDEQESPILIPEADCTDATGKPIMQQSMMDTLIHSEVMLSQGEDFHMAKVISRAVDEKGRVIGNYNENPVLNTLVYNVEFPDGEIKKYAANIIAENVLSQCDVDGHYTNLMEAIIDHKRDGSAVKMCDKYIKTKSGNKLRQTTVGWQFLIKWKDGTKQWIPLKVLKESNPIEVAEYVTARNIEDEPAFAWWVPYTLRKRDVIISAVNSRVKKRTHKYGIEVPRTIEEALRLDRKNGNTFWADATKKEMSNVGIAFEILGDGEKAPPGWTKASGHLIFDVKMDFTRKARWVKDGHRTPDPESSNYAGVVSRESVRIALTYAALNGIDVMAADIQNAYLQAPTSEKHYVICGPEFGLENVGKVALIRRALYGGKVAGRDFWLHLRSYMDDVPAGTSMTQLSQRSKTKSQNH